MEAPWPLYLVTLEDAQVIIISFHLDLTTSLQGRYVIIISHFNKMITNRIESCLQIHIDNDENIIFSVFLYSILS